MATNVTVTASGETVVSVNPATQAVVVDVSPAGSVAVNVTTGSASGSGSGDVNGPGSSTDNAIVRFNGTTGKSIQDSGITIADGASGTLSGTNSGDQTITLTGDVTGSGTGSFAATIANNAVTTAKIAASNVTLARIANASANSKLLGSGASGSGSAYTEITLGTNLAMSGTTLNATGSGSGDMLKSTYDPQNVGRISGASSGLNPGGSLTMSGGSGGQGGSISTAGGSAGVGGIISTVGGAGGAGGSIDTSAGASGGATGGRIHTYGNTNAGGDIFTQDGGGDIDTSGSAGGDIITRDGGGDILTYEGGGSIDTRATGTIQLGVSGTRTTLLGNSTGDRAFTLPNNAADCFAVQVGSGWTGNADAGDKSEVIPAAGTVATVAGLIDADYPGAGALLIAMAEKIKALETALVSKLVPNA